MNSKARPNKQRNRPLISNTLFLTVSGLLLTAATISAGAGYGVREILCRMQAQECESALAQTEKARDATQDRINNILLKQRVSIDFNGASLPAVAQQLRSYLGEEVVIISANQQIRWTKAYQDAPVGEVLVDLSEFGEVAIGGVNIEPALKTYANNVKK